MSDRRNRATYAAAGIVDYYAQLSRLQPAESAILERLRPQLSTLKMLDIGVGGGRTTQHFAPLVEQYVGIDYSSQMIAACQQRFNHFEHPIHFEVCDARDMCQFEDNSFDLILFSYNGIDYVSHEDRLKILAEIYRIGGSDCYFCFSSHNLDALQSNLSWRNQFVWNPLELYLNLFSTGIFWGFNISLLQKKIKDLDYVVVRDDSHLFRLETYYIRASHQIEQLDRYFDRVQIYPWKSRESLDIKKDSMEDITDLWLYYLCQIKSIT